MDQEGLMNIQKVPGQKELHTDKKYLDKKYQA